MSFNSFGDALGKSLTYLGLSNRDLAKKLDKHESQVSHWVNNRAKPYNRTLTRINEALGISIYEKENEWFIDRSEVHTINQKLDYNFLTISEKETLLEETKNNISEVFRKVSLVKKSKADSDTKSLAYDGAFNLIEEILTNLKEGRQKRV
jgi:transcriptional regulator with XRE-family HTH domain